MRRQSRAGPTVTQDIKEETVSISPDTETVISWLLHPYKFQKCGKKSSSDGLPFQKRKYYELPDIRETPRVGVITTVPAKWNNGPHNKWECISFTALGIMCNFSMVKSNFKQLSLPYWKILWFPKETKLLPSGLKAWQEPWARSILDARLCLVPPLSPL